MKSEIRPTCYRSSAERDLIINGSLDSPKHLKFPNPVSRRACFYRAEEEIIRKKDRTIARVWGFYPTDDDNIKVKTAIGSKKTRNSKASAIAFASKLNQLGGVRKI